MTRPLIPEQRTRPQGGGTQNTPEETVFAAIVYVLVSGCAWRLLPLCFGISKSTVHRRFLIWPRAGVWGRQRPRRRRAEADDGGIERDTTPTAAVTSRPAPPRRQSL
ncbi:transposase [Streptomyces viridosporus]|uniref:transposase n=1 Tax=Streptomyces viridosporus TaxID=67581 RepID=UPI003F4A2205